MIITTPNPSLPRRGIKRVSPYLRGDIEGLKL